jgi:hypothetical protein
MRGLLLLVLGCQPPGGALEEACSSSDECADGLTCENLTALGYWGGLDTGGAEASICTQACTVAADCPTLQVEDCGDMPVTCEEGFCRSLQICEG